MIDKTLKLLICFLLLVPLLGTTASANNEYDHNALMQYEGYGKAMYETVVEQSTFITGQYTDNKDYVRGSMNEVKDYADFWYNEYNDFTSSCYQSSAMNCLGEMVERGGGYVLTVGDWIKNLFDGFEKESEQLAHIDGILEKRESGTSTQYFVNSPYVVNIHYKDGEIRTYSSATNSIIEIYWANYGDTRQINVGGRSVYYGPRDAVLSMTDTFFSAPTIDMLNQIMSLDDGHVTLSVLGDETVPTKTDPNRTIIKNHVRDNPVTLPVPELKPSLVCPDGTKISMNISGSTFLSVNDEVMMVNKDGTAQVNGQLCNLNWQKPEVKYLDDKVVVQDLNDPDGNFEDVLCLLGPANCKPISKEEVAVEKVDKSLLQYVKNAYEYGTGVLKTATDGLKSLATGAKDLTSLFGTFFSWLPNEMVVLMASGLGITVGLRLFRK